MIDYDEEVLIKLVFRTEGSVMVRASMFAIPSTIFAVLFLFVDDYYPSVREEMGLHDLGSSLVWSAATSCLGLLLAFRTKQAMSRFWEGTSLLHQMRGEWFDAVSCCVTFSRCGMDGKMDDVMKFRHTLVRLMSLCHGSALEEIKDTESDSIETIDVAGLDRPTLKLLHECKEIYSFNRVELLLHLSQGLITQAYDDGVMKIAPPILSRVYQTLSRGFVNLLNAKKICDTRFPFPYAQLIAILLLTFVILTPFTISAVYKGKLPVAALTFIANYGVFSLNFIAGELENPFGNDDNDLPLNHFQSEMNNSLLMLLHTHSDHIAGISKGCVTDFEALVQAREDAEEAVAGHDSKMSVGATISSAFDCKRSFISRASISALAQNAYAAEDERSIAASGSVQEWGVGSVGMRSMGSVQEQDKANAEKPPEETPNNPPPGDAFKLDLGGPGGASLPKPSAVSFSLTDSITIFPDVPLEMEIPMTDHMEALPPPSALKAPKTVPPPQPPPLPLPLDLPGEDALGANSRLADSMDKFNVSVQDWARKVEIQVNELTRNTDVMQRFCSSLPGVLDRLNESMASRLSDLGRAAPAPPWPQLLGDEAAAFRPPWREEEEEQDPPENTAPPDKPLADGEGAEEAPGAAFVGSPGGGSRLGSPGGGGGGATAAGSRGGSRGGSRQGTPGGGSQQGSARGSQTGWLAGLQGPPLPFGALAGSNQGSKQGSLHASREGSRRGSRDGSAAGSQQGSARSQQGSARSQQGSARSGQGGQSPLGSQRGGLVPVQEDAWPRSAM